jgi:LmbE family N-acetylglucosaminyl deacetylase
LPPQSIACVFAHPDDETFGVGGMIAKYADAGHRIDLFCATNGDAGKTAGVPVSSRHELAEVRKAELAAAAQVLGIQSIETPGYGDGTLGAIDPTPLIGHIVAFIRHSRPAVIITFGPEGAPTGHRDHMAISRAATAAFFLSGLTTQFAEQIAHNGLAPHRAARLFYHSWKYPLPDPRLTLEPVPPTVVIDVLAWRERKIAAFRAHATQQLSAAAFETTLAGEERLALAAGVPQPRAEITDLFEGL